LVGGDSGSSPFAMNFPRDDLRTRSGAASAAFRREEGAEQPESVARTAQMITHPEGQTRSLCRGFFRAGTVSTRRSRIKRTASGRRDEGMQRANVFGLHPAPNYDTKFVQ
jgi:hypothetical protein